jgi:hypothetical protein
MSLPDRKKTIIQDLLRKCTTRANELKSDEQYELILELRADLEQITGPLADMPTTNGAKDLERSLFAYLSPDAKKQLRDDLNKASRRVRLWGFSEKPLLKAI